MPMIDLTVPQGALKAETAEALLDELAGILLKAEGAPDTDFFREITWVYLHEVSDVAVGGRLGGEPRFRVAITVPAGALSTRRKELLFAQIHSAVSSAGGLGADQALHVWTLIHEVPEGNWGAGGQVIKFEDLLKISASEREAATS